MTISTTNRVAGPFISGASSLPFTFKVFATSDLVVTVYAGAVASVLTLGSGYTVSLHSNQDSNPGGNVVLSTALSGVQVCYVTSDVPVTQGVNLQTAGGWSPKLVTQALDKLTILVQQLKALVGRAFMSPIGESGLALPAQSSRANRILGFDSLGSPRMFAPNAAWSNGGEAPDGEYLTLYDMGQGEVLARGLAVTAESASRATTVAGLQTQVTAAQSSITTLNAQMTTVNTRPWWHINGDNAGIDLSGSMLVGKAVTSSWGVVPSEFDGATGRVFLPQNGVYMVSVSGMLVHNGTHSARALLNINGAVRGITANVSFASGVRQPFSINVVFAGLVTMAISAEFFTSATSGGSSISCTLESFSLMRVS